MSIPVVAIAIPVSIALAIERRTLVSSLVLTTSCLLRNKGLNASDCNERKPTGKVDLYLHGRSIDIVDRVIPLDSACSTAQARGSRTARKQAKEPDVNSQ